MKINKIKINSFGKLRNKEIEFKNGINILYGENESGKSTIMNFIKNTLYGISKNKKGKEISDYDKYKPWGKEEFSGKLEYTLDNNEKYEIYRDFNKKNPKIYNENSEDISKEFNINKKTGNEFFYEQTKVDEELFLSTVGMLQSEIKLEKNNQNILVQKLANLASTGDDNVSYKRAIERINRRQLDEIGTDRSKEKPINLLKKQIQDLEINKINLEQYQNKKYEIEENEKKLLNDLNNLKNENNYYNEIKLLIENKKIEKEKINIKENINKENNEKINLLKKEIEEKNKKINIEKNKNNLKSKNKINKKIKIYFLFLIIINIILLFILKNKFKYIILISIPIYLIISLIIKNKTNKKIRNNINQEINEKINEIKIKENEINLIKINNEKLENEIKKLNNEFNLKNNLELEKIKIKYKNLINENKMSEKNNYENINLKLGLIQSKINDTQIEIHKLKLEKESVEPRLDKLAQIEEQLNNNYEKLNNLNNLNDSMEYAKNILEKSFEKMKNSVTPKFTNNLSETISQIFNNKYSKVKFNEENGLIVELENGDYVPADRLSIGTIDQLYLSLRISMIDELSEEKLPLFLDESFAYYDNNRLENALKYITNNLENRQTLIFTCANREKEILDKMGITYNYIEI
ncbi:MAG TPA: AAA family ATPase [Clostridiaceae bacterium]|nr:AAA family ATPase [Clostridiaceae bacterium]